MCDSFDNPFDLPVNTTPIQQLQAMPIYGNAMDDGPLFRFAHYIAADEGESFENRIAALKVMDKAMGEFDPRLDDPALAIQALQQYLNEVF